MLRVVTCRYLLYIEDNDKNLLVTCMLRVVTVRAVKLDKVLKNLKFSHKNQFRKTFRTTGQFLLLGLRYLVLKLKEHPPD